MSLLIRLWILIPALFLGLPACGSGSPAAIGIGPQLSASAVVVADADLGLEVTLIPRVLVNGSWHGPTVDEDCVLAGGVLSCPAGAVGQTTVRIEDRVVRVAFSAAQDVVVEAVSLEGPALVPGAHAWLSDGFQSWSQAGVLSIGPQPGYERLEAELLVRGDEEVVRKGDLFSWFQTFVGGGEVSLVAGAVSAARFKPWAQVFRDEKGLRLRLVCGGTGERVLVRGGEALEAEGWWLAGGAELRPLLAAYGDVLPSRRSQRPRLAEAGWNSWYELWAGVDEVAVRANASLAAAILRPLRPADAPPLRIVIDDGWQRSWGDWTPNEKFPAGLEGLVADLRAEGFTVGVWLAPLLVAETDPLVLEHPDWFVADTVWTHLENGPMRILDVSHPDAAAHLAATVSRLVSWGIDLLKIDFLFAGTFEGRRQEALTGMQAYAQALQIIRQAAGEEVVLVAVGAPGLPSFPFVDVWRQGHDIAWGSGGPHWSFIANQARSLAARWPFCRAVLCDADPPLLRFLPQTEVEAGVWVAAMAGGAMFLSDDLRALQEGRAGWLTADALNVGLGGRVAQPQNPIPDDPPSQLVHIIADLIADANSHVVPAIWILPDGRRLLLNVQDGARQIAGREVPAHSVALVEAD